MASNKEELPSNFRSLVCDFVNDLTRVFPEYEVYWCKWGEPELTEEELCLLFDHCKKVYPERFFDILYQNEEIFGEDSRINTDFLPKMSFKYLYNCDGVSENTKKILWKYLQLMLFTVVGNLEDKKTFGETMNIFEGIDENVLQEKLKEAMGNITDVFDKYMNTKAGELEAFWQSLTNSEKAYVEEKRQEMRDKYYVERGLVNDQKTLLKG